MHSSSLLVLCLLAVCASTSKLVYVEIPSNTDSASFTKSLADSHDVRGEYGNFVLVVDHINHFQSNEVLDSFDDTVNTYYVVEPAALALPQHGPLTVLFSKFNNSHVMGKYVFAVPKGKEAQFGGAIPFDYEYVLVPSSRLPAPYTGAFAAPGAPDPNIQKFISGVNADDLKAFVTYLTGEDPTSPILTRQSLSTGAVDAQKYLEGQFGLFGFSTTPQEFRTGYSSNVVASLPGNVDPRRLVLVTAHYDSRASNVSSPTDRAPGANDNGSGTGALLQIAKLIYTYKISFKYSVLLIAFSGEEQGLVGSAFAAQQFKAGGADIIAVLNADMIAYRDPNEVPQLAFPSRSSTVALNNVLGNISQLYVPELTVGTTTACCTDHASFYNQGYPAASFYERNGPIVDPQYHKVGDLVYRVGYDIDLQYPLITRAIFAGLLTLAEYQP